MVTKNPQRAIEFDYDAVQWAKIESCVRQANQKPWSAQERNALPDAYQEIERSPEKRRQLLKNAAAEYFRLQDRRGGPSSRQQRKHCEKLARSCASLQRHIAEFLEASGRYNTDDPVNPLSWDGITWNHALRFLADLECGLRESARPFWWSVGSYFSSTGRIEPRVVYLQRILSLWTLFGGRLKISNNAGAVTGPLARFLAAVTFPVMGDEAPKPASYRKLIQRQKAFYRKMVEIDRAGPSRREIERAVERERLSPMGRSL